MTTRTNSSSNIDFNDLARTPQQAEADALEDLAAQSIEIPTEKIEAIRRKYGFPQAWYDEDSKPF